VRLAIHVHPGAARTRVGHGGGGSDAGLPGPGAALDVWVTARAVEGQATEAALQALADAIGVRRRAVRLVTGARSRIKIVEIDDPPADLAERLAAWS